MMRRDIMKILRIVASHFQLCEDNFTISFVPIANKTKDDKEFELNEIAENLHVFSTLGIIGKNASGKTTTTELLSLVYDIFSNYRVKYATNLFKFMNKTVELDITFYHEKYLYHYTTELKKDENLVDENTVLFQNQKLYMREYKKSYSTQLFNFDKYEEMEFLGELPDDTSILYLLLKTISRRGIYISSNTEIYNYSDVFSIYKMLNNSPKIIESILQMFDEHIKNIEMISDNKYKITYTNYKSREVTNRELHEILSSGTTRGLGLFTFVVFSLKFGCDLIIDEIETHFHKMLVENLVNLYKDKSVNKKNATLIFTTHYCELLDLFGRNDNIYISKFDNKITLENMHEKYNFRPELSKSNKFYKNAFNTDINYESLMNFKKELM